MTIFNTVNKKVYNHAVLKLVFTAKFTIIFYSPDIYRCRYRKHVPTHRCGLTKSNSLSSAEHSSMFSRPRIVEASVS